MKEFKLAILGYGNAGRAFGKLLTSKQEEIKKIYDADVKVSAIITKTKGSLVSASGINLCTAEHDLSVLGKFSGGKDLDALQVATEADYDVLIELTPLNIFSGQPAIDHIKAALCRGKHVISANKGPIAWAFRELQSLARQNGCLFFYETTVMDGTPVFNLTNDTLKMCKVQAVSGILNTTTNFILEELAKGIDYEEVLTEGQRRGFVEADPAMDVEGWDAAAKLTALLNVLMDADITPHDIDRKGIEGITGEQLQEAKRRGKVIKLVCHGSVENGKVRGSVKPCELDENDMLAAVTGTSSIVSICTDLMGTISVVEHDPEIEQTAYGIFSDLLRVIGLSS